LLYVFLAEKFVCITAIAFMLKIKLYQNFSNLSQWPTCCTNF